MEESHQGPSQEAQDDWAVWGQSSSSSRGWGFKPQTGGRTSQPTVPSNPEILKL